MKLEIRNNITPEEVNCLRASVGFLKINHEQIQSGLEGSTLIVSAYIKGDLIGMSRLIWDGGSVALIVDVLVLLAYQMKGVEKKLIVHILDFLKQKLRPGYGIQVDIKAWSKQKSSLESLDFKESFVQFRGLPMHICLTEQIEVTDKGFKQGGLIDKDDSR